MKQRKTPNNQMYKILSAREGNVLQDALMFSGYEYQNLPQQAWFPTNGTDFSPALTSPVVSAHLIFLCLKHVIGTSLVGYF